MTLRHARGTGAMYHPSNRYVTSGTHCMTVAPILEAGELKGSRGEGRDFSVPAVYSCPEGQAIGFWYGTRTYIIPPYDSRRSVDKL